MAYLKGGARAALFAVVVGSLVSPGSAAAQELAREDATGIIVGLDGRRPCG